MSLESWLRAIPRRDLVVLLSCWTDGVSSQESERPRGVTRRMNSWSSNVMPREDQKLGLCTEDGLVEKMARKKEREVRGQM